MILIREKTKKNIQNNRFIPPKQSPAAESTLIKVKDGKIKYLPYNEFGDVISDFSYAGFYSGNRELPDTEALTIAAEISPSGTDDDTELIQNVIDKVYGMSDIGTFKVIKLKAGIYNINEKGISLKSGILLSGEGQGPDGTVLYAKEPVPYNLINVEGAAPEKISENILLTDSYINSGSNYIHIKPEDIRKFKKNDTIVIHHPSSEKWVSSVKMVDITNVFDNDNSWSPGEVDMTTERIITAVDKAGITLEFGVFVPYDKNYSESYIYKIDDSNRIHDVGIENLRLVSYYNGDETDEQHAVNGISLINAKNVFIRNITAKHFTKSLVVCGKNTKQVTIQNCSCLEPVSIVTGGRRYAFATAVSAQQILCTGCYSHNGRHDYVASYAVTGPIVFVDNVAESSNASSETHGTWSTGVLYDNLYQITNRAKGLIALANRGLYGTKLSQGWSSGCSIVWNSLSSAIIAHKPPLSYQNFVIGTWGLYQDDDSEAVKKDYIRGFKKAYRHTDSISPLDENFTTQSGSPVVGDAFFESEFAPVEPRSLYKAQLAERLTGSIFNAKPNAPIIIAPSCEEIISDNLLVISGIYQSGADKVTIYVDDVCCNAELNLSDNSFKIAISAEKGVHKIYATQTVGGVESNKTADRFVTVVNRGKNYRCLQSLYPLKKTSMLVNQKMLV